MKMSNFFRLTLLPVLILLGNLVSLNADAINCNSESATMSLFSLDNLEDSNIICCGKKYIPLEKIALVDNFILVEIENEVFETLAIYNDENGFYIENVKKGGKARDDCGLLEWKCHNCRACNSVFISCCTNCNWHISGEKKCE